MLKLADTKAQVNILDSNTLNHAWASKQGVTLNDNCIECSCWAYGHKSVYASSSLSLFLFFYPFYNMFCLTILYACQAHGHKYGQTTLKTSWILAMLVVRHCGSPFDAFPLRICRICLIQTYSQCARGTAPNAGVKYLGRECAACFSHFSLQWGEIDLFRAISNRLGVRELKCVLESKKDLEPILNCH